MRYVKYEVVPINGIMLKKSKSFVTMEKGQFKVTVKLMVKSTSTSFQLYQYLSSMLCDGWTDGQPAKHNVPSVNDCAGHKNTIILENGRRWSFWINRQYQVSNSSEIYIWMTNGCVKFEECSWNPSNAIAMATQIFSRDGGDDETIYISEKHIINRYFSEI